MESRGNTDNEIPVGAAGGCDLLILIFSNLQIAKAKSKIAASGSSYKGARAPPDNEADRGGLCRGIRYAAGESRPSGRHQASLPRLTGRPFVAPPHAQWSCPGQRRRSCDCASLQGERRVRTPLHVV